MDLAPNFRKRKSNVSFHDGFQTKRLRNFTYIALLPDEILLYIFSFISMFEQFCEIRLVCRKWYHLVSLQSKTWNSLSVENNVSTALLKNWIRFSPAVIREFKIANRFDADVVLKTVSRYARNLESIEVMYCWGSAAKPDIQSKAVCDLMKRCKRLQRINFECIIIKSCKMIELAVQCRRQGTLLEFNVLAPLTERQIRTIENYGLDYAVTL